VVDLGCGPGNSTALLRERWPSAALTGVDSSAEMLRRARQDLPGVDWICADAKSFTVAEPVDVLFSNALLQWLPDHASLLPALLAQVDLGGALAVQVPFNFSEPSHRLMRETPGPWASRTAGVRLHSPVQSPAFYYDLLARGAASVDIWQTTYEHVMPDVAAHGIPRGLCARAGRRLPAPWRWAAAVFIPAAVHRGRALTRASSPCVPGQAGDGRSTVPRNPQPGRGTTSSISCTWPAPARAPRSRQPWRS
jgi:SAM-dependent methyltransferase